MIPCNAYNNNYLVGYDDQEEVQREAERELEALGRKTDTWLAIFQVRGQRDQGLGSGA